jgi:hypothetical protein
MRISYFSIPLALAVFSQPACSPKSDDELPPRNYRMGESAPMGHLICTVIERQWLTQIGEGVDARIPQNRFYLIRISAVNSGGAPTTLPTISLADDSGGLYPEIDNGSGVTDFIGALRQIAPAETAQGNLVFDVQPKHYKLKLKDDDGKEVALIDLPLSFDPDTPDVTTPLTEHTNDLTKK